MNRQVPEALFHELLEMADVSGVALLTGDRGASTVSFRDAPCPAGDVVDALGPLVERLAGAVEAEFVFECGRMYIRRTKAGILVVVLDPFASLPLVRLQCDVLIPELERQGNGNGRRRLWRRGPS